MEAQACLDSKVMGKVTRRLICECTYRMGRLGFEPRTNRLKAEYSTVELATRGGIGLLPFLATGINHNTTLLKKLQV